MKFLYTFFIAANIIFAATAQETKTLKECIQLGIRNNLLVNNANIEIDKSKSGLSQNRAKLLPVITGQIQYLDFLVNPVNVTTGTLLTNDFDNDPVWQKIRSTQHQAAAGVQLAMPIYNPVIFSAIDLAETALNITKLSYDKSVENLTMQISKAYYQAQTSLELESLVDTNIARMTELCEITSALYQAGVVLEVDLSRVEINRKNLLTQKSQYHALYSQCLNTLRFLLDMSIDEPFDVERLPNQMAVFKTNGWSHNLPELLIAQGNKELIEKKIKNIKAGYLPSLSFLGYAGGIGYQEKFSHFFHTKESTQNWFGNIYVGLSINIPIFDGKQRNLQIHQQKLQHQQACNLIKLQEKQTEKNYQNASLQYFTALDQFDTQSENRAQAQSVYETTMEKYKEGVSSMTELLQDEMRLQNTQSACVQAQYQCNIAKLELLKLSGELSQLTK